MERNGTEWNKMELVRIQTKWKGIDGNIEENCVTMFAEFNCGTLHAVSLLSSSYSLIEAIQYFISYSQVTVSNAV
jgi:hypothetical protein